MTQMKMPHFLRTMWRHLAEATAHTWAAALAFKESQRLRCQRSETKSEMPLTWRRLQAHKHRSVSARLIGRDPYCRQLAAFTYWERVSEWVCLLATAAWQGRLTRLRCHRDHESTREHGLQLSEEEEDKWPRSAHPPPTWWQLNDLY